MILNLCVFLYFTPSFKQNTIKYPIFFYLCHALLYLADSFLTYVYAVNLGSYFASISDKCIGGKF